MSAGKHAIVIGANGLVGTELTKQLLENPYYDLVTIIVRRYIELEHEKLNVQIIDFKSLHKDWNLFSCDEMFYCLGTTRNDTPKSSDYYKIEYDYCVNIAKISQHNKVKKFIYVSTSGASTKSLFYYLKIKGEVEEVLKSIGFEQLHILKPFFLTGKRDKFRIGEVIMKGLLTVANLFTFGLIKSIKLVPAFALSNAMIKIAQTKKEGVHLYSNKAIHELYLQK